MCSLRPSCTTQSRAVVGRGPGELNCSKLRLSAHPDPRLLAEAYVHAYGHVTGQPSNTHVPAL